MQAWIEQLGCVDGADLWLVDLAVDPPEGSVACLDERERERLGRFAFERDRRRYAAGHVALRQVLSRYVGVPASGLAFTQGEFGKPGLQGRPDVSFNFSDSGEVAMLAVQLGGGQIGVDVEVVRAMPDADDLAQRLYRDDERSELLAWESGEERDEAFLRCWTRKEACVKAIGSGLSIEPGSFSAGDGPRPAVARVPSARGAEAVAVQSFKPAPGMVAAFARVVAS